MSRFLKQFAADESGATAIEYGLIAAGIAVAIITAINTLSGNITDTFNTVGSEMAGVNGGGGGGGGGGS